MLRTGFGVACVALLGAFTGCTTDVPDPGLTATAGMTTTESPTATDSSSTAAEGESSTGNGETTAPGTTDDSATTANPTTAGSSSTSGDPTTGGTGNAGCGDGVVSPGEQCDGADLQGLDCTSLGLGTGTLGCDPMMCTFDTSMCMSDSGGGTSG